MIRLNQIMRGLVQLFPVRGSQAHHELPGKLRVAQGGSLVSETAPLEMEGRPSTPHRPTRPAWPTRSLLSVLEPEADL